MVEARHGRLKDSHRTEQDRRHRRHQVAQSRRQKNPRAQHVKYEEDRHRALDTAGVENHARQRQQIDHHLHEPRPLRQSGPPAGAAPDLQPQPHVPAQHRSPNDEKWDGLDHDPQERPRDRPQKNASPRHPPQEDHPEDVPLETFTKRLTRLPRPGQHGAFDGEHLAPLATAEFSVTRGLSGRFGTAFQA